MPERQRRVTRTPVLVAALGAFAGGFGAAGLPEARAAGPAGVRIRIDSPQPDQRISNHVQQAPVEGAAQADAASPSDFDVMLVFDVSGSTQVASGVDVDGDGETGFNPQFELVEPGRYPADLQSTDPQDTILDAELRAARELLDGLDWQRIRVGVIAFSGEMNPKTGERMRWDQQDAWLHAPLSANRASIEQALGAIRARGPHGGTNFAAGLRLAVRELAGFEGASSAPRPQADKIVLFLTDGLPTFPIGTGSSADPGDTEAALQAARLAREAGIRVNTYALGPNALTNPIAATEVARLTLGHYQPVVNPGDIISFLQGVSFANIEDVVLSNLTTREVSTDVRLAPDGSFRGFVPVRAGANRIRVTALATDGGSGSREFDLFFEESKLSERELAQELERIRERNRQLLLLVEKERIQRFREQQRKVVEIEAGTAEEEPAGQGGEAAPPDEEP